MNKSRVQAEVLRCDRNPHESDAEVYHVVVRLIEPSDEYLMGALALAYGAGPKKDRRKSMYGVRSGGR